MNDQPRRKLREIIEKHGHSVIENPRRVEGLLRDYCGGFRREISALTMALEEHAVADMLAAPASSLPRKVTLARITQRLCDHLALSESAARWAVESWAWALGLISDEELTKNGIEEIKRQGEPASSAISPQIARANKNSQPEQAARAKGAASAQTAKITVSNPVFVISASGGNFASITDALRNAPANSRLLIREGVYNESIVLDKNIEIVGDGAVENIVVISRNQSCVSMKAEKALVRGVTLQGRGKSYGRAFFAVDVPVGELTLENCRITSDSLSGVAIHGASANPLIKNCVIYDAADSGIYVFDNAGARIENCDVYRSANASLAITEGANPTAKNCRFFEGENGGIVVWGNGAAGTFENCEISGHRLANVGIRQHANPVFRRCKIYGGRDTGVFIQQNGYGTFEECDIYKNSKAEVAVTDRSNTILRRCSVHNGRESGVYVGNQARALVESCSVYDNLDAGVAIYGESAAAVRRSNINRNGTVAVRVKQRSAASVEDCDLRGNRIAIWETEHGIVIDRKNNRER
jgi:parallel beta-helix repeat protein